MNMNISGSGTIPAGEYEKISISGAGKIDGEVHCESLTVAGSGKASGRIVCDNTLTVSGAFHSEGEVEATNVRVSGSAKLYDSLKVRQGVSSSGALHVAFDMNVQGGVEVSGVCKVGGGIEAEQIYIEGSLHCEGLMNAENVKIRSYGPGSEAGSIGCSVLDARLPHKFSIFRKKPGRVLAVRESIEADEIYIEYTKAKRVSGRKIMLGEGCEIEVLQYSDSLEGAPVNNCRIEKI